ncbi:MAG TPA: ATP-binding protein [Acidimicrobiales bacterium]
MRERRPLDAFVGRDAELETLTRSLDRALGGDPAVALVAGEPGIGKSRLVDALAAEARRHDVRVVWGEARDDRHAPLSLWAAVERALGSGANGAEETLLPSSERRWELVDRLGAGLADAARCWSWPRTTTWSPT